MLCECHLFSYFIIKLLIPVTWKHQKSTTTSFVICYKGCHWTYEIVGILLSNKLEPLQAFKEAGFFEFLTCDKDFDDMPSPRLLNTHMRLKHLPKSLFTEVGHRINTHMRLKHLPKSVFTEVGHRINTKI